MPNNSKPKPKKSLFTTASAILQDNKEYQKYLKEHAKELRRLEREARGDHTEYPDATHWPEASWN